MDLCLPTNWVRLGYSFCLVRVVDALNRFHASGTGVLWLLVDKDVDLVPSLAGEIVSYAMMIKAVTTRREDSRICHGLVADCAFGFVVWWGLWDSWCELVLV